MLGVLCPLERLEGHRGLLCKALERDLSLAQAFFAIFSLQASMFHTFGTGERWEHGMNLFIGCGVCLLIVSIGIYMIRRGNREIRQLQEIPYGE